MHPMDPPIYSARMLDKDATDCFWSKPKVQYCASNGDILCTLSHGTDASVMGLPNSAIPGASQYLKCVTALECKLMLDAAMVVRCFYSGGSDADYYRRLLMLPDRLCLGCRKSGHACMAGRMRCKYCGDVDAATGLEEWLRAGSPARHAETVETVHE